MSITTRSNIIFEALTQVDPEAAQGIKAQFNDPKTASALGMAALKRSLGLGSFEKSVRND